MSIGKFIKSIFGGSAGQAIKAIALSEADKAVAALKTTAIGGTVAANIKALTNAQMSGSEKFEKVAQATMPLVLTFLVDGGTKAALKDVEDIARGLVQSTFNDVASTKAGGIAALILRLLGVK
jgi:hypothetical protein